MGKKEIGNCEQQKQEEK